MSTSTVTAGRELNQPATFRHVVAASRKRLFAVFDDPDKGLAAIADLSAAELIAGERTWLFHGEEGLRRLDAEADHHGVYGGLVRAMQMAISDDNRYIDTLARALRRGALVVALPVHNIRTADHVAESLRAKSGRLFAYTTHLDFVPTRNEVLGY